MKKDFSNDLNTIKFKDFSNYLEENNCFGLTASKRKNTIIYFFERYFIGLFLHLKIKVDRKTKNVISVMVEDKSYTDLDKIKKLVEKKWK